MPANGVFISSSAVDTDAVQLAAWFGGQTEEGEAYSVTGPYWACEYCRLHEGVAPSYALVKIPTRALDEAAPTIAGVNGSPIAGLRVGQSAGIAAISGDDGAKLLAGFVTDIDASWDASQDHAIVRIEDARWWLNKAPIIGSFWMSGTLDDGVAYRQGWHLHVNPRGAPNCIFRKIGGAKLPVMCTPYYGLNIDEQPPSDADASTSQACYWTNRSMLKYLRMILTSAALTKSGLAYLPQLHANIIWPESLASAIEEDEAADASTTTIDRKAAEHDYDGTTIGSALQRVISASGPYSLYCYPSGDNGYKGTLQIVRTRYRGDGVTLNRPTSGDAATALADPKVVLAGSVRESAANLYTRFAISGDLVYIERRIGTGAGLLNGWDESTQTSFATYVKDLMDGGQVEATAIAKAHRKFPHFAAAYQLDTRYDFQANTSQSGFGIADVGRPILPHVLTSYLQGEDGAVMEDAKHFRRPVLVEYSDDNGLTYYLANYNDGFTIDADGTLWFHGLREASQTYSYSIGEDNAVTLNPYRLRMTVAIPCDHALNDAYGLAIDTADIGMVDQEGPDNHKIERGINLTYYASTRDLYGLELRRDAYPVPPDGQADDKDGGGPDDALRDDTTLLIEHIMRRARDYGRLDRAGVLVMRSLASTIRPGLQIKGMASTTGFYPLNVVARAVVITNNQHDGTGSERQGQTFAVEVL